MPRIIIAQPPKSFPNTRSELAMYKARTKTSLRPTIWASGAGRAYREEEEARWALTWLRVAFRRETQGKYTREEIALMTAKDIEAKINSEDQAQPLPVRDSVPTERAQERSTSPQGTSSH